MTSVTSTTSKTNYHERSIEIILAGQAPSGAYVASPNFSQYGACWLRDGTWIAYAMDCVGHHDSARRFYEWADRTLRSRQDQVEKLLAKLERGETPVDADYLPTRFTLDGGLVPGHWGDFQLDGYGTWLWGLVEHVRMTGNRALFDQVRPTVQLLITYLEALYTSPNYDCWEELPDKIHPATLAAIYGGLEAIAQFAPEFNTHALAERVKAFAMERGIVDGHFMKYFGNPAVDASLLWSAVPYGMVSITDPVYERTLAKIERDLHRPEGGVYRFRADVFFGGGEWLLLTAWLGWVYAERGDPDRAKPLLRWIEAQAAPDGSFPEQVSGHTLAPDHYQGWVDKWGPIAVPLLWSHAMYLILESRINR